MFPFSLNSLRLQKFSVTSEAFHLSQRQGSVCVTVIPLVLGTSCACTGDSPITTVRVPQLGERVWPLRPASHPGPLPPSSTWVLSSSKHWGPFCHVDTWAPSPPQDPCMCCSAFLMYFPLQEPSLMPSMRAATFISSQLLPHSKPGYTRGRLR